MGISEDVCFSPLVRGRTVGLPCRRAMWGMAQVMVIVLANPCAHVRSASLSRGASNGVAIAV